MFKSQLQELCQRRKWPLPEYAATRDGPGHELRFRASVTVNGAQFHSPSDPPAKSSKEAQNMAAQVAFQHLGASDAVPSQQRLPPSFSPAFLAVENQVSYKSQLQSYAHKRNKDIPVYNSLREGSSHAPRFKATVTVGGQTFESPEYCNTLREAEQAAAKVALMSLPIDGDQQDDSGFYKNLLQELAQKEGFSLPKYNTVWNGDCQMPRFSSVVEIESEHFEGDVAKTKKQAEINAAKIALNYLNECKASRVSSGFQPNYDVQEELEPSAATSESTANWKFQEPMPLSVSVCIEGDKKDEVTADDHPIVTSELTKSIRDGRTNNSPTGNMDAKSSYHHKSARFPLEQIKKDDALAPVQKVHPDTATKNEKAPEVEDMTSKDGNSSSSTSVCSNLTFGTRNSENREGEENCSFLCNRVQVYPRKPDMVLPEGVTMLPFSNDMWVAVSVDFSNNEGVIQV